MKNRIKSIIALLVVSTLLFSIILPVAALNVNADDGQKATSEVLNVPVSERYHVIENGYKGKYDLQEGVFGNQASQMENKNAVYFYSDGYFADSPEIYNPSLATMSFALANSAFNARRTDFDFTLPGGSYSNLFRHVKVLVSDLGFKDEDIYINRGFSSRPTDESIGMIMSAKEISLDGEDFILMPIIVRGGDYETEWSSNVTLGASGESDGFSSSASKIITQIEEYLTSSSSFDIESALRDGKVKFWVVGYSRGGAVANITAKRLTDTYGKSGNSVYSYTFEAPSGGLDVCELNESWTYNGTYANIHNVINANDLVPKIPPKQMGFKRYGIDHYVPGTDAGEITVSTYVTPTGITVTTRADNEPLTVGEDSYEKRRENMLKYLSCIDSNVTFSDDFSVVSLDLMTLMQGESDELLNSVAGAEEITAAEWLDVFIEDLLTRAANGTYNYGSLNGGGYGEDYREFYTSNSDFAGKSYATLEESLRQILDIVFTNYYDEEFAEALLCRASSLLNDYYSLVDVFFNAVQKWDKLSPMKQAQYLNKVWKCLNGDMTDSDGATVKKLTDFVPEEEYELTKNSVYTLSAVLFLFISKDNNASPSIEGVDDTLVHLVTFIANGITLIQGHFPEVCFAWLCTYDENYSLENSKYLGKEVKLVNDANNAAPEIESKIEVGDDKSTITLSSIIKSSEGVDANSKDNGSAVYYAIFENGNMINDWQLYINPIVIDTSSDTKYTVKAFGVRFEEMGLEIEISDAEIRTPPEIIEDENGSDTPTPYDNTLILAASIAGAALILVAVLLILKKSKKK